MGSLVTGGGYNSSIGITGVSLLSGNNGWTVGIYNNSSITLSGLYAIAICVAS